MNPCADALTAEFGQADIRELDPFEAPTPRRPLRVLTFTSLFPNGEQPLHGLFVRERIKALSRLCDLRVVAPVPWAPSSRRIPERYYRYSQIPREENQDGLSVVHPRYVVVPKVLKMTDGPLMAASCASHLRALHQRFPFDVIDAHWMYPDGLAAVMLGRLLRVPVAVTVRGDDINVFAEEFGRRQMIRHAIGGAGLVIALSNDLKHAVERLVPWSTRVAVVPNGIDSTRFRRTSRSAARHRLGLTDDQRIILSVGRLHTSKGFPILVEAIALLRDSFPDARVVIVGAPDHESDATAAIRQTAERFGVADRVLLAGPQSPTTVVDWYSASDLFCLPTSREGSANVLYEALSCGLPCVTTPVGGNSQIVSSPDLGLLGPAEPRAMAAMLEHGLTKTWNRWQIASEAGRRTWDVVAQECHDHLTTLVERSSIGAWR